MMLDPFNSAAPASAAYRVGPSGDNGRVELVSDNEAVEISAKAKAPLDAFLGTEIDAEA